MVREFTLVDGNGEEYSLTNEEHLLFDPSGLGFERENTYRQVGNRFILANSVPVQSVIEGTVCFTPPDAYFNYQEFVEFCGRDGLKMEYRLSEMASRRVKRLIGTVDWIELGGEKYAGRYNFITGDYVLTEKILECDENTVVNTERTFFSGEATLYSISISQSRDTTKLTYCNGIPALTTTLTSTGAGPLSSEHANGTFKGGYVSKIYFSLHQDALQGKTISQWFADHDVHFSYTLNTPITGNAPVYKFNPKMMYNPLIQFFSVDENDSKTESVGEVSYIDTNGQLVTVEGNDLILENTEINQELDSLIVYKSMENKNENSRFWFVGTNLIPKENNETLQVGDSTSRQLPFPSQGSFTQIYSNLPLGYISLGYHMIYSSPYISGHIIVGSTVPSSFLGASVTVNAKLNYVKDNGDTTYTTIYAGQQFSYKTIITNLNPSRIEFKMGIAPHTIGVSDSINSVIYPQIDVSYTVNGDSNFYAAAFVDKFYYNGVSSIQHNSIPIGSVNISNMKLPSKSITQISQADSQHYQRSVRLNKIEKTELTKSATLETEVEFECLEPWGDPFTSFVEHGTSPDPVNSITLETDCHTLSPCDLYISGPCTNPTWTQTVNGVKVTTGGYTGTIASGEQLLIRAKDGACGIYLINGSGNTDDVYKYSDFSKDRFVYIRYGENVITVTDGTDPTTQIDCYIEGELYYESV